jgi:arylsulfatase A-like enzyme
VRNTVLVTIDSLRADHCGFMEYEKNTTPTLDEMANEGLSFETAIAPGPSTYESMPAIFTGQHMCQYPSGDGDVLDSRGDLIRLNTRSRTIPERFADAGYATAAFTTNPYTGAHTNFARGFDYYEDFLDGQEGPIMRKAADIPIASELKHLVTLVRGDRASKPWQSYYDAIREWIDQAPEPYFLWVFLLDPHTPYLAPDKYREGSCLGMYYHNWKLWADKKWGVDLAPDREALIELYDATVRSTDAFLERLRTDLCGDPVIAVHADHGEAFGEHGGYGHDSQLYEENLHVPFVVWNTESSKTVTEPVSLTALPEILHEAAIEESPVAVPDGEYVLARTLGPRKLALHGNGWKYIATIDLKAEKVGNEELYDLEMDASERENRVSACPDFVESCRRIVKQRLAHEGEVGTVYRAAEEVA